MPGLVIQLASHQNLITVNHITMQSLRRTGGDSEKPSRLKSSWELWQEKMTGWGGIRNIFSTATSWTAINLCCLVINSEWFCWAWCKNISHKWHDWNAVDSDNRGDLVCFATWGEKGRCRFPPQPSTPHSYFCCHWNAPLSPNLERAGVLHKALLLVFCPI